MSRLAATLRAALLAAAAIAVIGAAAAQPYPAKPIRLVVPFAPGGGTDNLARIFLPRMSESLGQQIVIDNRPGAGGNIGVEIVAKAPADGYTLLMVDTSFTVNPNLFPKLPFDTLKDFAPVTLLAAAPVILVAHPSVPANTVQELVALAKAKPGTLNYASGGNGASTHLGGELFRMVAGIDIVHIPYKGTGPAMQDLLGGHVSVMFSGISSAKPQAEAGKLRALAVTGAARNSAMPEVPTFAEAGLGAVDAGTFWGMLAPAGTPPPIIERLHAEAAKALALPDIRERIAALGYDAIAGSPAAYADNIRAEIDKWGKVIKTAGIKVD
jgi:tripartite-type tricarboxylate transporter receptor subunit TctC